MLDMALVMRHNEYYDIGLLRGNHPGQSSGAITRGNHPGQREAAPPPARRARNDEGGRIMKFNGVCWGRIVTVVGVAAAGPLILVAGTSVLVDDGRSGSGAGYVLLTMEQAGAYHGRQIPGSCTGTANRPECSGNSSLCGDYSWENCPSTVFSYPAGPVTYCVNWVPSAPPGSCSWGGATWCYTQSNCVQGALGNCYHPGWPLGWSTVVERNNDTCIAPTPPPPPPPP